MTILFIFRQKFNFFVEFILYYYPEKISCKVTKSLLSLVPPLLQLVTFKFIQLSSAYSSRTTLRKVCSNQFPGMTSLKYTENLENKITYPLNKSPSLPHKYQLSSSKSPPKQFEATSKAHSHQSRSKNCSKKISQKSAKLTTLLVNINLIPVP